MIEQLPIAKLVEDMSIYPRHEIDMQHVGGIVQALEAGGQLPPIVADKKSLRIVDGWHRCRAYKRFLGSEAVIDVELRAFRDDKAIMLEAVNLNATHGRRLDRIDQVRIAVMLREFGIQTSRIALALHVTERQVEKLHIRIATASVESHGTITGTTNVALKRPVQHLAGTRLSADQVKVHESLPGTSFLLVARQLAEALRAKMVNLDDGKLMDQLKVLRDILVDVLK